MRTLLTVARMKGFRARGFSLADVARRLRAPEVTVVRFYLANAQEIGPWGAQDDPPPPEPPKRLEPISHRRGGPAPMTYEQWHAEIMKYRHIPAYRENADRALRGYIGGVRGGLRRENIPLAQLEELLQLVEEAEPTPRRRRGRPPKPRD